MGSFSLKAKAIDENKWGQYRTKHLATVFQYVEMEQHPTPTLNNMQEFLPMGCGVVGTRRSEGPLVSTVPG